MPAYQIIDQTTHSSITLYEGIAPVKFWALPKTITYEVSNGYLDIYLGKKLILPKIPRALISVPGSSDDEDLFNQLSFLSTSGAAINAVDVQYDNSVSGLTATNVQTAIDELAAEANVLGKWVFVTKKEDLPAASLGDITLEDNTTYVITKNIDLTGDRLIGGQNTTIIGGSSESCWLTSTGLVGKALIKSAYSLPIRNITISADVAIDLVAVTPAQALDWFGVNFTNCSEVGTISGYTNFIMTDSAFLNSQGLVFDGTIGTVGFLQCLFNISAGGTMVSVPPTAAISRRIRFNYCSFVAIPGTVALNVDTSASIPVEGYFLDTVNFSGGGTYLIGVQHTDNKAYFTTCRGIANSGSIAQYYMRANAVSTPIAVTNTFYKAAGTTSPGIYVEKFSLATSNRATYIGSLTGYFRVTAILTISSSNNNSIIARIAKNGTASISSEAGVTTDANGRIESFTIQDIVLMNTNDYIEIFVGSQNSTSVITLVNLSVIVERLN